MAANILLAEDDKALSALILDFFHAAGLEVLPVYDGEAALAAVQDGARPFVTPELIDRVVRAANAYGAAAPAVPVRDTIKVARGGLVERTPDRSALAAVQTPQVFDYDLLQAALNQADKEHAVVTDDCSAVERLGMKVKLVEGEERNFKVTTRQDLLLARALLQEEET